MERSNQSILQVCLIIPVYNEVENIERVIKEVKAIPANPTYNLEILVVDGGSKDGTVEAAKQAGARVVQQRGRGYGAACYTGFEEASFADILVYLDGDYSDPPAAVPLLLQTLLNEKADLVLGSRTLGKLERGALPPQAIWGNRVVVWLIRLLHGYRLTDLPSFKAIWRKKLAAFAMQEMTYGWTTEMLIKAVRSKSKVVEVGVDYRKRGGGQSKVSGTVKGTIKAAYSLLKTALRYTRWQEKNVENFAAISLLANKYYDSPSVFTAANLLREARRQKNLGEGQVPAICVLDPDGDFVEYLSTTKRSQRHPTWACYHTNLDTFVENGVEFGVIGRVVGASFAVLVAEELFASGCQLLISVTSAGQICEVGQPPYVVLIDRALRDEGTSYHYLPPAPFSFLNPSWVKAIAEHWDSDAAPDLHIGASWTTDAPFRETEEAIEAARKAGILAVEMEAAALYALATTQNKDIICFAHVTNQMAQIEGDFEKGQAQGSLTILQVLEQVAKIWQNYK